MDVFGNAEVELIHDLADPTPIYISDVDTEFYSELGLRDADLVVVRDEEALSDNALEGHYEICRYLNSDSGIYIGEGAPQDFPSMKPQEVERLVDRGIEALVDEYLGENSGGISRKSKRTQRRQYEESG